MNSESSNNGVSFSSVESTMVSQPQQQKQHVGGQNSRILHNLGSQMGSGIRSGLQQKAYGFSNGALNGGFIGNNMQLVNGPSTSDGYLSGTLYGNSSKPLQQQFDQHQRPLIQGKYCWLVCVCVHACHNSFLTENIHFAGDGYGMNTADPSASANFYNSVTSAGSMMNNQNLNAVSLQSIPKANSNLIPNQSNLHNAQQAVHMKPQSVSQSEKANLHSSLSSRENILQSHQQQQFQQQPHQFQQQFVAHQRQQKPQQQQILMKNDPFGQPQLTSDLSSQVKTEIGGEQHGEIMHSQVSDQFQLSELQNQLQQNSSEDNARGPQLQSLASGTQDMCSSISHNSQQIQQLHPQRLVTESQKDFSCLSIGEQTESVLRGQWNSQSQGKPHISASLAHDQHVQEEFRQRITRQDEAQCNNLSSEGSIIGKTATPRSTEESQLSAATCKSANTTREKQFRNQQRWLLFLRHARRCTAPEGKCQDLNCITVQKLWRHMDRCTLAQCPFPRCLHSRILLQHNKLCRDPICPVCIPVKNFLQAQLKARTRAGSDSALSTPIDGSCKARDTIEATRLTSKASSVVETSEDLQPSSKRLKMEQPSQSLLPESESSAVLVPVISDSHISKDAQHQEYGQSDIIMPIKSEFTEVKMEIPVNSVQGSPKISEVKKDNLDDMYNQRPDSEAITFHESADFSKEENVKIEKENDQARQENVTLPSESIGTKSGKPKIKGVSLTELFTPEQIREHITGLRQWVGQVSPWICFCCNSLWVCLFGYCGQMN